MTDYRGALTNFQEFIGLREMIKYRVVINVSINFIKFESFIYQSDNIQPTCFFSATCAFPLTQRYTSISCVLIPFPPFGHPKNITCLFVARTFFPDRRATSHCHHNSQSFSSLPSSSTPVTVARSSTSSFLFPIGGRSMDLMKGPLLLLFDDAHASARFWRLYNYQPPYTSFYFSMSSVHVKGRKVIISLTGKMGGFWIGILF